MTGTDCHPFFIESDAGPLFAVHHRPAAGQPVRGQVLCVAPFNEEMNRCRSMITLQAQAWARLGFGTLLLDLHGTGDSAGDFADARWTRWLADINLAWHWLAQQAGARRALWGIRLGALLATQAHATWAAPAVDLLLWQPVSDGKTHLTQFLRVKIAAQMDRTDLPKETTASMRAQLAAGQCVEVGGYALHPELTTALDNARLAEHRPPAGTRVLWLENAVPGQTEPAPATQLLLSKWPGAEVALQTRLFEGPAFWQVHERMLAPDAIRASSAWLDAPHPESAAA